MAKLVLLSAGMTGRIHELTVAKTTIGRVEDNAFQIAEPSVSSHHCEIELKGGEVVVKDLNSTNGTFINGEKIAERVLKAGQTLRRDWRTPGPGLQETTHADDGHAAWREPQ
jgi:pSer/pThr/pTyr-binding forkhead associated (FHA) protein